MEIKETDYTIAVVMEPEEARAMLRIILASRVDVTRLNALIVRLDMFLNGGGEENPEWLSDES